MTTFCVAALTVPSRLRARHGVLQSDALAVACHAERAAALTLLEARAQAAAIVDEATARAADAVRHEQQRVAQEGAALLDGLRAAQDRLLEGVGPLAIDLATRAFERLVAGMTPPERIACAVRQVREEAPQRLLEAVAWVHPDDLPLLADCPWDARADARLAPGTCRLEAASGQWQASFDLGAAALMEALRAVVPANEES